MACLREAWICCLGILGGCAVLLVATNPGPEQFETYAANQAVQLLDREVCRTDLQEWLGLVTDNCNTLVQRHHRQFGQLIGRQTRRLNLGLFSLYRTRISARELIPSLPSGLDVAYELRTVGVLGQFQVVGQGS
jgi:hypothetical protein